MSDPERILILRLSHLGDVVCTLSLLHALHEAYPSARIHWVVQSEFAPLLEGTPGLAGTVRFERHGGLRAWVRLRSALRHLAPDLAVDAQGNLKSAAATLASGARRRVGWARGDWREPLGAHALTERAAPTAPDRPHAVDRVETLIRHLAPELAGARRHDPGLSERERERGRRALRARWAPGALEASAPVVVHLSSDGDVRGWSEARWDELLRRLQATGRPVLVLSGPKEHDLGERLAARRREPGLAHSIGQRDLRGLAAGLTAAAEAGGVFVGCDSGPTHLAWACGLRVVLLAGPQAPERTGPWPWDGPRHRVVRAQEPPHCAPCLARRCDHRAGPVCMGDIEPAYVLRALEELEGEP